MNPTTSLVAKKSGPVAWVVALSESWYPKQLAALKGEKKNLEPTTTTQKTLN
jgi:hypothetical protein